MSSKKFGEPLCPTHQQSRTANLSAQAAAVPSNPVPAQDAETEEDPFDDGALVGGGAA